MDGKDVTGAPPAARDVALVFQNFSLYPNKTVRQNLDFPLRAPGRAMTTDEIRQRVEWAAELLKISHCWIVPPRACPAAKCSASRSAGRSSAGRASF
jgi:ABC-type sugar transport system ATPase subunit